jgi:hypothetical protein
MLKFPSAALQLFGLSDGTSSGGALAVCAPSQMADLSLDHGLTRESPWIPGIFESEA